MIEVRIPYKPNEVTPPGETLADLLQEHSMTQAELAERLVCSQKIIAEVIAGIAPIPPEMALQLEHLFATPTGYWLRHEAEYRAFLARQRNVQ